MSALRMEDISPAVVEQGISEQDQTMTLEKVFWSHFSPNLVPAAWVIGVLLIVIGLDFTTGLIAIIVGNVLGSLPVALAGLIGPKTRLTQMESSRFSFGKNGARVPAIINWAACVGWDAVNNVPSVIALLALLALPQDNLGFVLPVLAVLVIIQMFVGIYGHHLVQVTEKYLGYFLLAVFAITGLLALRNAAPLAPKPFDLGAFVTCVAIVASFNIAWAPYSSDYTRYLPKNTPNGAIFWRAFLGLVISAGLIELFGLMTASTVGDPTPGAVISSIGKLVGPLAPLALFAIGISSIAVNALNDNTGAYSLISAGVRVPRHVSAIIAGVLGFLLALLIYGQYAAAFEQYLLVLLYWIAPWVAIILTHWWLNNQVVPKSYPWGWTRAATIFLVVAALTILLFASVPPTYVGPIAQALGGTDIGYFVGFIAAAVLYAATAPRRTEIPAGATAE